MAAVDPARTFLGVLNAAALAGSVLMGVDPGKRTDDVNEAFGEAWKVKLRFVSGVSGGSGAKLLVLQLIK
jgi:hypothetical protein